LVWLPSRKDITVPIKDLAEATGRIASGDLKFPNQMKATDEIGMLVHPSSDDRGSPGERSELEQRKKYMEIVLKTWRPE